MKLFRNPALLFSFAICATIVVPALFMEGMFQDGVLYVSVARNHADGMGSFWDPFFSQTMYSSFHEQPPLLFFLEGIFFRVLGDHFYTERIFCFVCLVISALLIIQCWKVITGKKETGWWPLLLWIVMPVVYYGFINNLAEIVMGIFVLAALICILKALKNESRNYRSWIMAGSWLLLAGLTKGVQGMFLISAPFFAWIILRNGKMTTAISRTFFMLLPTILFVVFICLNNSALQSFQNYYQSRIVDTFTQTYPADASRFHMLKEWWLDSIPSLICTAFVLLLFVKKIPLVNKETGKWRMIAFLFVLGLSGILPLMTTLEQRGFYLVTAMPFPALVLALLTESQVALISTYLREKRNASVILSVLSLLVFIIAIAATVHLWKQPKRDADKLSFLELVKSRTGNEKLLQASLSVGGDWSFVNYSQRYYRYSLTSTPSPDLHWYLMHTYENVPEGFSKTDVTVGDWLLCKKQAK